MSSRKLRLNLVVKSGSLVEDVDEIVYSKYCDLVDREIIDESPFLAIYKYECEPPVAIYHHGWTANADGSEYSYRYLEVILGDDVKENVKALKKIRRFINEYELGEDDVIIKNID